MLELFELKVIRLNLDDAPKKKCCVQNLPWDPTVLLFSFFLSLVFFLLLNALVFLMCCICVLYAKEQRNDLFLAK